MAQKRRGLNAKQIEHLNKPGLHAVGDGLYLRVKPTGSKFWAFRYMLKGRAREMGLGTYPAVSLDEVRHGEGKLSDCQKLLRDGIDPIETRKQKAVQAAISQARHITLRQCAEAYIHAHKTSWQNAKHLYQWNQTLESFTYPILGHLPVEEVDVSSVMRVLEPLWQTKTETAKRLRGRIEVILDWAKARNYRDGDNPARWRGLLENLLPRPSKLKKVEHYPALPYDKIGAFMAALKQQEGIGAQALAFTILTASRTGEAVGARWSEVDLDNALWTVPANRIKAGRIHRVPLSPEAIQILKSMQTFREGGRKDDALIFPSRKQGVKLSNMSLLSVLRRMGRDDIVTHGFRSSFRDWCAEQTDFPREVAEAALAHINGDKFEASYLRSDLFNKRRQLMEQWGRYCYPPKGSGRPEKGKPPRNLRKNTPKQQAK